MVGPTVSLFRGSDARILLCATPATIESQIYQNAFRMIGKDVVVVPIYGLAGAIECGAPESEQEALIGSAFQGIDPHSYDVLVLACTHYPFATRLFKRVLGENIQILDPADAVAARVEKNLWPREVGVGKTTVLLSKESAQFEVLYRTLFPNGTYELEILP
jgi:glutamate racemase